MHSQNLHNIVNLNLAGKSFNREIESELQMINIVFHHLKGVIQDSFKAYHKCVDGYKERTQTGWVFKCRLDIAKAVLPSDFCGHSKQRYELLNGREQPVSESEPQEVSIINWQLLASQYFHCSKH